MRVCSRCRGEVDDVFRFCPWCGTRRRTKIVEFFKPHADIDSGRALRVSRYLGGRPEQQHVRFSVWSETADSARAEAAVSLDHDEATRLAAFLLAPTRRGRTARLREVIRAARRPG